MDFAALQHSIFLQALGSTILNSLWQALILWVLYETISVSYKNASARFKNNISTILLFLSFIFFVSGFISKLVSHQTSLPVAASSAATSELSTAHTTSGLQEFLSYAGSSLPYLSVAYIFLLFFLTARLITAYRYVYIISNKRLVNPPKELEDFANKVFVQMGITNKISIWISQHIDVPATIGFIKPVILIPLASLNNLSGTQLEAIILHELSHIKRNDYIINIIVTVIETMLFFNPFVVLLSKVIKRERENCCDDFVLQYRYDPHSYASALLRLEQSRATNLKLAIGAVSGKKQLLSRIKRITNGNAVSTQFNYGQKLLALLLVTAIICSVAWLSPSEKKQTAKRDLQKNEEVKMSPKTNSSAKTTNLPNTRKENFQQPIPKHNPPKRDIAALLKNEIIPGFPAEQDKTLNEKMADADRFPENAPLALALKTPQVFFDKRQLKLPASINIKNFPFLNSDFNIDLSSIDVSKLNENLQLAYKEIENINWSQVQNDIRENFSKVKIAKLPAKEQVEFLIEKSKELSKLDDDKLKDATKSLKKLMNKGSQLRDSLSARTMVMFYDNNVRIQREYQRNQSRYTKNKNNNSCGVNYSTGWPSEGNAENNTVVCINGNSDAPTIRSKNLNMLPRHTSNPKSNKLHQKKFIQFSFDSDTNKPGQKSIINVEMTDLP